MWITLSGEERFEEEAMTALKLLAAVVGTASLLVYVRTRIKSKRLRGPGKSRRSARLHLVGAGPGDPELMTLAAVRAIREADMIVADVLVAQTIIDSYVGKHAEIKVANKTKGNAHEAQEELQQWTLEGLQRGLDVVRLKGGDPFLYGRGGEEVQYFSAKGFDVEVIPGLSSSMVGPMSMGIPVTTRGFADQFAVATLHGRRDTTPGVPSPYRVNRTVVFLMSVARLNHLVEQLVAAEYPKDLPVSVVERATTSNQRNFNTTINSLLIDAENFKLASPAIIVVGGTAGNVANLPTNVSWDRGGVTYHA